jgi:hypothetical protein
LIYLTPTELKERTKEAYESATENGYIMDEWSWNDVALDMLTFDAFTDCEEPTKEQIVEALTELYGERP